MSIDTSIPHSLVRELFPKTMKAILVMSFIKIASLIDNQNIMYNHFCFTSKFAEE